MRYLACNEELIRRTPLKVLRAFYVLRYRNPNGILYPNREVTARKMRIDRSTLSRWIGDLVEHELARKTETGHVVLTTIREAIKNANGGYTPRHKCTLRISEQEEVGEVLLLKLLEEFHRQVQHKQNETKITQAAKERYGDVSNTKIRRTVKSFVRVVTEYGVPLSGRAIAERLGVSERRWHHLRRSWIAKGWIRSYRNEESLGYMEADQYRVAREHFGFASKRKKSGEVLRVLPNLVQVTANYRTPWIAPVLDEEDLTLGRVYFMWTEMGGEEVPVLVLPRGLA